jgi:hypothetical protein
MDKVLIADLGLEGGGATIHGRHQDGNWFFWLEGTSMDLDENDDEVWRSWETQPVPDLFLASPKEWPLFYPTKLNPDFLDRFRKHYDEACSQLSENLRRSQRERQHPEWMRLLHGRAGSCPPFHP